MTTKPTWLKTESELVTIEKQLKPLTMKLVKQTLVEMFMSPKFRWTANGLCPVWLVPETHEEAN